MGCCGQSGQRVNPAKPIFLLPGGVSAFHPLPVALAMRQLFAPVKQECPVCSVLVGRQLSPPVHVHAARLPFGSCLRCALDLTTPSSAFTQGLEM